MREDIGENQVVVEGEKVEQAVVELVDVGLDAILEVEGEDIGDVDSDEESDSQDEGLPHAEGGEAAENIGVVNVLAEVAEALQEVEIADGTDKCFLDPPPGEEMGDNDGCVDGRAEATGEVEVEAEAVADAEVAATATATVESESEDEVDMASRPLNVIWEVESSDEDPDGDLEGVRVKGDEDGKEDKEGGEDSKQQERKQAKQPMVEFWDKWVQEVEQRIAEEATAEEATAEEATAEEAVAKETVRTAVEEAGDWDSEDEHEDLFRDHRSIAVKTENFPADLRTQLSRLLGGVWGAVPDNQLRILRLSAGHSSALYYVRLSRRVQPHANEPRRVMLRLSMAADASPLHLLAVEACVYSSLPERHRGPRPYGCLGTRGRVEEFLPVVTLATKRAIQHDVSELIARRTAALHTLSVPLSRDVDIWRKLFRWNEYVGRYFSENDDELRQMQLEYPSTAIDLTRVAMRSNIIWIRNMVTMRTMKVVFSHNDLHAGNILFAPWAAEEQPCSRAAPPTEAEAAAARREAVRRLERTVRGSARPAHGAHGAAETVEGMANAQHTCPQRGPAKVGPGPRGRCATCDRLFPLEPESRKAIPVEERGPILFADYQHASYNYQPYDIANHFNEWMFDYNTNIRPLFDYDANRYPDPGRQRQFIYGYLMGAGTPYHNLEHEANKLAQDIHLMGALSHMYWALWSLARHCYSRRHGLETGFEYKVRVR
ncbi:uncharacterized protein LOC113211672 [Frankliniella occidentalis]|uniref:Uncharacterized protein LOC113211672 n=1 Tax=Frankliniella occidentalis TaxID=133901 RepID=A0A6J1SYJ6_FRAOC|nr:uncharacterized protein LOC113211672 [Frankliniella occidentalis]